jgi:hypothetical protein
MSKVLRLASVVAATTGLALLVVPSLVGQLLLGQQLVGVALPVARVTAIALIARPGSSLLACHTADLDVRL